MPERPEHRSSTFLEPESQKWTASRCSRILRQLSSKLAHLRLLVAEIPEVPSPRKRAAPAHDDPKPKRARQTYSRTRGRRAPLGERTCNVATTPVTKKTLGAMRPQLLSSPAGLGYPTPICAAKLGRKREIPDNEPSKSRTNGYAGRRSLECAPFQLDSTTGHVSTACLRTYTALFDLLVRLFRETQDREDDPPRKSLLGMCLRKLPDTLAHMEQWDQEEAERRGKKSVWKSDEASDAVYEQLDAFGSHHNGWAPFKILVRSHALKLLSCGISEGLFETLFVSAIARLYFQNDCAEEAAHLLATHSQHLIQRREQDASAMNEDEDPYDGLVKSCTEASTAFSLRQLGNAFACQHADMQTIAPDQRVRIWRTALTVLTQEGKSWMQGFQFVEMTLHRLASSIKGGEPWTKHEDRQHLLTSLAAGIVVTALETHDDRNTRRLIYVLDATVTSILQRRGQKKAERSGLYLLMLARQLVLVQANERLSLPLYTYGFLELEDIIAKSDSQTLYQQTLAFACSIAYAHSHASKVASYESLGRIRGLLQDLPLPTLFLQSLKADGAFLLAHKTKDLRDLAFAESQSKSAPETQPRTKTVFEGWRWEAGISEWVLPSPHKQISRQGTPTLSTNLDLEAPQMLSKPMLKPLPRRPSTKARELLKRSVEPTCFQPVDLKEIRSRARRDYREADVSREEPSTHVSTTRMTRSRFAGKRPASLIQKHNEITSGQKADDLVIHETNQSRGRKRAKSMPVPEQLVTTMIAVDKTGLIARSRRSTIRLSSLSSWGMGSDDIDELC